MRCSAVPYCRCFLPLHVLVLCTTTVCITIGVVKYNKLVILTINKNTKLKTDEHTHILWPRNNVKKNDCIPTTTTIDNYNW